MKLGQEERSWFDYSRILAIIVTEDGTIYQSECDHQSCMLEICKNYWSDRAIDISEEFGFQEAVEVTNSLFMQNKLYGFDVLTKNDKTYLVSHYPQNLEKCYQQMKTYAEEHNMILATFVKLSGLGDEFYEVLDL